MRSLVYISIIIGFFSSCKTEPEKIIPEINWTKKNSTDLSKNIALQEEIQIKLFLEMHKDWVMDKTGSGLQMFIFERGDGDSVLIGEIAEIEYAITLLDGTECYKTESDEYQEIIVDQSEAETGLQEAIKKMRVGDRAKLIIPSHIGHGLIGDMNKIPPLTTLVVDVNILGSKK